uniref:heme exporter protein CcmD n=1 Tax=Ningiella ruwaisensis TaxID=2364274 RepID=UPI001447CA75
MWQAGFKFSSGQAFFDMGGRGFFVWLSYAVSLLAMLALAWQSKFMSKAVRDYVAQQQARAARIIAAREKRKQSRNVKTNPIETN